MTEDSKIGIELLKNLVRSGSNVGSIQDSITSAFEIDSKLAIKWFEELSKEQNHAGWHYIQNTLFNLLPSITKINKKSGVKIFNNLLSPEFEEEPLFLPFEGPTKRPKRNTDNFWIANEKILDLFEITPKEIFQSTFNLVLEYHNIPKRVKGKGLQDVYSTIWYYDDSHYDEVNLLRKLERKLWSWADNKDPRLKEVLCFLDKSKISLGVKIYADVLLTHPKINKKKLFELATTKTILLDDCLDYYPKILKSIQYYLTQNQIKELNTLALSLKLPKKIAKDRENKYKKYLAISIPKDFRSPKIKKWLENEGRQIKPVETLRRPIIFTSFEENEKKIPKPNFSELNIIEQENELRHSLNIVSQITKKDDKLDLLKNIETYLNNNKSKIKKDLIEKLEPIIWKFCKDPDPEHEDIPKDGEIGHSLISYPTVRAYATSCLLILNWHNPRPENMDLITKMSKDENSFVRENICKNLRYISAIDYPFSLRLAQKFVNDNSRVHFFLTDFLNFNVIEHPSDILEICKEFIKKYGKNEKKGPNKQILEFVTSLTTQLALRFENKEFEKFFNNLLNNNSYISTIKHQIAFTCKDEKILFDNKHQKKVLKIYLKLIMDKNQNIRSDAEFFLLYSITKKGESFWPEIKPFLDTLSKSKYEISEGKFYDLYLVSYLEKFWKEFPSEASNYLFNLYTQNPQLTHGFHRSRDTISLIGDLYQSNLLTEKNKLKIIEVLMEFIKTGWSEASIMLKKLEVNV